MLVFVDESYHEEKNPEAKSTFAAVLVRESKYRDFDTRLFDLKKHFWKVANPYDLELKGRKLMNERALIMPKTRDFISQIIWLCKEVEAVVFAVVQDGSFTLASESDHLPSLYRALMRRVNTFMEVKFPEEQATFFFDGIDHETNRTVAISFNNFMFRHWWGRSYKNIIPTSFFCDSLVSPGIQMADVLAYCVNQRYGGRRGHLEDLFQQFRAITYNHEYPMKVSRYGVCSEFRLKKRSRFRLMCLEQSNAFQAVMKVKKKLAVLKDPRRHRLSSAPVSSHNITLLVFLRQRRSKKNACESTRF